jgi:signal transduction histidine kinase
MTMRVNEIKEDAEILLVIAGDPEFLACIESEFSRRRKRLCVITVCGVAAARKILEVRPPSVILLEESALANDPDSSHGQKPTLWAAVTSLAESAPVVVIGSVEHQGELTNLLASGLADYVTRSASSPGTAVGLVERRLRQRLLRASLVSHTPKVANHIAGMAPDLTDSRDFGEVLRHELNNPLTGILGNAELLLVELRRRDIELPATVETRLETIATLAVRMRETVRRLSEEWESNLQKSDQELVERHY